MRIRVAPLTVPLFLPICVGERAYGPPGCNAVFRKAIRELARKYSREGEVYVRRTLTSEPCRLLQDTLARAVGMARKTVDRQARTGARRGMRQAIAVACRSLALSTT